MSKPEVPKKKRMGRPPKGAGAKLYHVRLTEPVVEHYRKVGDGNLTAGIEAGAQPKKKR